jgi:hypothetical protein
MDRAFASHFGDVAGPSPEEQCGNQGQIAPGMLDAVARRSAHDPGDRGRFEKLAHESGLEPAFPSHLDRLQHAQALILAVS